MNLPAARGQRALILASLPMFCPLCAGEQAVRVVRSGKARGGGRVRCPHCQDHMPVVHLPYRTDLPRGAA